jgi:hypothetical protein
MEELTMKTRKRKITIEFANTEGSENIKSADMAAIIKKVNEAIDEYRAENPEVPVETILYEEEELQPTLRQLSNREMDKFIAYAKDQGTKMPFASMEMGILAAGRMDIQNGLAEILDSVKFDKPKGLYDRGRGKKNF